MQFLQNKKQNKTKKPKKININIYFADFEQVKKMFVIFLNLNK